jgi:cytoskeletal protein RodZ
MRMPRRPETSETTAARPRGFDDYELRLGDVMRGERATLGKSLLDIQRELKIKASYIAAIENADPSAFATTGFIAGYVRSYARFLGLDPDWAYEAFRREAGLPAPSENFATSVSAVSKTVDGGKPAKLEPFGRAAPSYLPAERPLFTGVDPRAVASVAILCALIGGIGYGGWAVLQEVQKVRFVPVDQAPEIVAELDPLNRSAAQDGETSAGIPTATATADALDRLYRPKALDMPVMVARDGPIATLDPASIGALAPLPGGERSTAAPIPEGGPLATAPTPLDTALAEALRVPTPVVTAETADTQLNLVAVRPTWVRVRAADGTVIFEKILDANETWEVPRTDGVPTLRAGNAGSLYFAIGDRAYGPAGDGPSVVKDIKLSVDDVTAAFEIADVEADSDLAQFYAEAAPPAE